MRWRWVRALLFLPRRRTRPLHARRTQPLTPLLTRVSGWSEFCDRQHFFDGRWPLLAGDMEEILEAEAPPYFTTEMLVVLPVSNEFDDTLPASYAWWNGAWYSADTQQNASP